MELDFRKQRPSSRMSMVMNAEILRKLFAQVRSKKLSPDEAVERLRHLPFEDLGFAKVDHHRALRQGMPEVIFSEGKTPAQVAKIFLRLAEHEGNILATRATEDQYRAVATALARLCGEGSWGTGIAAREIRGANAPARESRASANVVIPSRARHPLPPRPSKRGLSNSALSSAIPNLEYRPLARCITLHRDRNRRGQGIIAVVSAGTSDIPVAEEAVVTAEMMGNEVRHLYDVGVAGIHRLLANRSILAEARVIIVCAGMEGALPSVVGGLVGVPVIAVPTSIGYGAAFKGLAALLGMLNSCASNVSVVNIDNGFGAAYVASQINRK
jgi:pyridinium-3,5-biscarboxylic acid mononucleotide synthase